MSLILDGTNGLSDVDGSASTPAIRGTDTNTGIFFPAADTIAFAEGGVEQMRLNSAGDLQMNSGYGSVATAYGCRAWVNFNGTGTPAIRASGNVSSITDVLTGQYVINFTTAMPNTNYSACLTTLTGNTTNPAVASIGTVAGMTTSSISIGTFEGNNSPQDYAVVCAAIFR